MSDCEFGSWVFDLQRDAKRRATKLVGTNILRRVQGEDQEQQHGTALEEEHSRSRGAHKPTRQHEEGQQDVRGSLSEDS